jgi:hypothetical protein
MKVEDDGWYQNILTLATGLWFSPSSPVSSTNKTDHHDITEILLKVTPQKTHQIIDQLIYLAASVKFLQVY